MRPPDERSRPIGRLPESLGQGDDTADDRPRGGVRSRIEATVRAMTFPELAAALVDSIAEEPGATDFACPRCQGGWQDLLERMAAARTLDGVTWECAWCGATGTRWQLEALVLTSAAAVKVVMDLMAEAVTL